MKIVESELKGVRIIFPPTVFEDYRGSYVELYNDRLYREMGIQLQFIQDDISTSCKNVLRGVHGDNSTWKLISCLFGAFYLVVVDNDPSSMTYKKWQSFTLSDRNRMQILIPPKFGNAHLILTDTAIFHYKQTTEYDRSSQFTIKWNDPSYNIWWPIQTPILSIRDS
jgi:dTDP-4-dehydrorhamnose 3,5-epimerase